MGEQAAHMVAAMKAKLGLPKKTATASEKKKSSKQTKKEKKEAGSKKVDKKNSLAVLQEDNFDDFVSAARHGAEKELQTELESTTNALTGHMSVASVPADQLQKLAQLAQAELKRRKVQSTKVGRVAKVPAIIKSRQSQIDTKVPAEILTEQATAAQEHGSTPKSSKETAPSGPGVVNLMSGMASETDMEAMIKASVAQALGKTGVDYDEAAVDAALLQEN